ncbi:C40 family peptidase [Marinobacterium stanieri]|uniref:C40 family peptidase n=1 Tax=Marinobacterium stanieri TaxID=49186 RepID=UPI0002558420|nr:NlpC/P60 family protein [Marinobacterium stanieri]
MALRPLIVLLLLSLALGGCSTQPSQPASISFDHPVRQSLLGHYAEWAGTPYRFGGVSRNGVDCSGFIQQVYLQADQRQLPRSTADQSRLGMHVPKHELQPGDLVFFKTGFKQRHAGIYLGNSEFMHASTSRGVMISRLTNPYWSEVWWMARRLP